MKTGQPHSLATSSDQGLEAGMLAAIVASSSDAIVSKTLDGSITSWNAAATTIFGYLPDEVIGKPITTLIPEDLQSEEDEILRRLRLGERVEHFDTLRRKKNGQLVPVSLTISPIRDRHDRIVGASKIARDISERKRHEERQQLLMNELKHRVKNMLSTVGSIARQSFRNAEQAELLTHFLQRLSALNISYDYLIGEDRKQASLGEVTESVLAPFMSDAGRIAVAQGASVMLQPNQAPPVALAINELATNAVKYGALSQHEGHVDVSWESNEAGEIVFSWAEIGGPTVDIPSHSGFGTQILTLALRHELRAETELVFAPEGLRFNMRFRPAP